MRVDKGYSAVIKPVLDVFQGFALNHLAFNIIFEELQSLIRNNLPLKYVTSDVELDYIRFNRATKFSNFADFKVFCSRSVDDIIVLCTCLKKHARDVQRLSINFLRQKGVTTEKSQAFQGKVFKPGFFLKYASFKLIYADLGKLTHKNKYVQLKYTCIAARVQKMFLYCLGRSFYVLMQRRCIKNLRNKLKVQLSKKNSWLAVDQMIGYLNSIIINSFKQYNISFTIVRQLLSLNNLVHKLFYKYLLRKYSSLPNIYSYIKTHFQNQSSFGAKNKFLF